MGGAEWTVRLLVHMDREGRITIPAIVRRMMGLRGPAKLRLEADGERIVLTLEGVKKA